MSLCIVSLGLVSLGLVSLGMDTFFLKCGENDFECHDTFDSESEMTSN